MTTAKQEVADLKKDIQKVQDVLADQLANTQKNGVSASYIDTEAVAEKAKEIGQKSKETAQKIGEKTRSAVTTSNNIIKNNPLVSTAIAFGAGALAAAIFSRRK